MLIKEFFRWRDHKSYLVILALVIMLLLITLLISNRRIQQLDQQKLRLGTNDHHELLIGSTFYTHFNTFKNE